MLLAHLMQKKMDLTIVMIFPLLDEKGHAHTINAIEEAIQSPPSSIILISLSSTSAMN
jgi:hypothetical protein